MTMTINRALVLGLLAMTGCKIPRVISCGKCGDLVSRAEACAASPDYGLVFPFGDIDVATAEVLLNSLKRVIMRTIHMNKITGDDNVSRTNRVYQCSFITRCIAVATSNHWHRSTIAGR
jgi:hypothetical protein